MTVIQAVRQFFHDCPLLQENRINVDYLPENAKDGVEFSIYAQPAEVVLQRYMRGNEKRQFLFALQSINSYGADVWANIENSGFFEQLGDWVKSQRVFPDMGVNKNFISIEVTSAAYLTSETTDTAVYEVQCALVYSYTKGRT